MALKIMPLCQNAHEKYPDSGRTKSAQEALNPRRVLMCLAGEVNELFY